VRYRRLSGVLLGGRLLFGLLLSHPRLLLCLAVWRQALDALADML
jgi:hypothetical protein